MTQLAIKALITAELGNRGYRQFPVHKTEAFQIDAAMDTDTDQFSVDIGSPTPDLRFLLNRDNEVRVSLFTTAGRSRQIQPLHEGIADQIEYTSDDMTISIVGRDLMCVAYDSQAPPGEFRRIRPQVKMAQEARGLGITKLKLAPVTNIGKIYRDGSESYGEFWYRMYRQKKMWVWSDPNGTVYADKLNYAVSPSYYFGWPRRGSQAGRGRWINVERCRIVKDTQKRVGEVWVFGERGDIGFVSTAVDPSIRSWKRRPLRIVTSSDAKSKKDAREEAWEEIFEGKVGALEIELTIPYEGTIVKQNHMAMVNISSIGLTGIFYIVGTSLSGGIDGYSQTIRLREKNFAISRRMPTDPELLKDPGDQVNLTDVGRGVGSALSATGVRWAQSFASAAREFHGGWDYSVFLGVLLAMCDKESGFRNVRESGDVEWYPHSPGGGIDAHERTTVQKWRENFANSAGNPLNPFGREAGVGPMQLTTLGFKVWADEFGGNRDEYGGGRWAPQSNIRAGARAFAGKLSGLDPRQDSNIWIGVERYNGSGSRAVAYAADVRQRYKSKYEKVVEEVVDSATVIPQGEKTEYTVKDANGNAFTVEVPDNAPNEAKVFINYLLRQLGKPYGWGDEGPGSFDCSGLIIAAAKHAGNDKIFANSSRPTTYTLDSNPQLKKITKDSLMPGDLVLFARGSDVHHVGIYLNDGHMIHAPKPGDVVKISSINTTYYMDEWHGGRRMFEWQGRERRGGV